MESLTCKTISRNVYSERVLQIFKFLNCIRRWGWGSDELEVGISKNLLDDRITINSTIDVPVGTTSAGSSAQSFAGDIEVIYKITSDGRIRAKAFNRNNLDNPALDVLSPYTQGLGIFYQTNFNTYGELFNKLFGIKPRDEKQVILDEESTND